MDEMKYPFALPEGTVLEKQYTLIRALGQDGSGITYEAYEIHMGETRTEDGQEALCCQDKNVFGTYLHGIFDTAPVQEAFFGVLRRSSGRDLGGQTMFFTKSFVDNRTFKELQYDKLAQTLRASLDMKAVYEILEGSMRC